MDPLRLKGQIAMFGVVGMHWLLAVAIPAFIFGFLPPPPQHDSLMLLLFAAIVGYCTYTGYRAWKGRWRSRFVLRPSCGCTRRVISFVVQFLCIPSLGAIAPPPSCRRNTQSGKGAIVSALRFGPATRSSLLKTSDEPSLMAYWCRYAHGRSC
jgi:hypothetical protein